MKSECWFPCVAVTQYHKLDDLKHQKFVFQSLQARNPNTNVLVGSYSLQCSREKSSLAYFSFQWVCQSFGVLGLQLPHSIPPPPHLVCSCMCLYYRPLSPKDQSHCIRAHSNSKVFVITPYQEKKIKFSGFRSWDRSTNFLDDQSKIVMCRLHQFTEAVTMAYELHLPCARLSVTYVVAITQHSIKATSRKEGWFLLRGCHSSCQRCHGDKSWQQLVLLCLQSESRETSE